MGAPCTQTCSPWATVDDACNPCTAGTEGLEDWIAVASDLLFHLSGRQYPGTCTEVYRPCTRHQPAEVRWWGDRYRGGFAGCGCSAPDRCSCGRLSQVRFPVEPLVGIESVWVDGVELTKDVHYHVDDHRWLVRLDDPDGTNPGWPCCQDLTLDRTEDKTFEVTVLYGVEPPRAGKKAAVAWACQMALACSGDDSCTLPARTRSVTREGITFDVIDPADFTPEGSTGVILVDAFLAAYNPRGLRRRAGVLAPETAPLARKVGT